MDINNFRGNNTMAITTIWCFNKNIYWTEKENKDELDQFRGFIMKEDENHKFAYPYSYTGPRHTSLCDLLEAVGIKEDPFDHNGFMSHYDMEMKEKNGKVYIFIGTYTEGKPMPDAMEMLMHQYPHLHLAYCSEKRDSGIYVTNDRNKEFFQNAWALSISLEADKETLRKIKEKYPELEDSYWEPEEKKGLEFMKELFQIPNISDQELLQTYKEKTKVFEEKVKREFPEIQELKITFLHIEYV